MEPDKTPDPQNTPGEPPQEGGPRREFVGGLVFLAAFLGGVALLVVYILIFFAAGAPNGRVGALAYIPVAIYLAVAVLLVISRPWMSAGIGMLTGLGVWLLIGGGPALQASPKPPACHDGTRFRQEE